MCPGIILLHEYFHLLVVNPNDPPSQRGLVFHGSPWPGQETFADAALYALHHASSLENFTVHVALGTLIECACPKT
jgi:hypothetical protein